MADVGKALRLKLLTVSDVTDLVSSRIYPQVLPEGVTFPAIAYNRIGGNSDEYLEGTTGTATTMVQLDCYAVSQLGAEDLAEKVRLAIHQWRGISSGVTFLSVNLESRFDGFDKPEHGNDLGRYRIVQDYRITHSETAI